MANYKSTTKDGKCIFCEIVKDHEKTAGIFWEDKKFLAFLSPWPNTEGFTVLIPKKHYGSDCLAMPDNILKEFIVSAKKVSRVLLNYFDDVGRVGLIMEGTGIDHAHIKLVPMHGTAHMKKGIWKQYLSKKSDYFKKYRGYIISTDGPKVEAQKIKYLAKKLKK